MNSISSCEERTIRVFVSSTFRDMQAERDELVLRIYPQLRQLCEERGVTWAEIDLRWGISEEQSKNGQVLPIILEEIRRCRPYFIGLLGERYGWIPEVVPTEVIEAEPWIREHVAGTDRKSVTELEIRHGVLNNPEMAGRAFLYFRDPGHVQAVAMESRKDFSAEDAESAEKLERLKKDIRNKHREGKLEYAPRENYADAKALGQLVLADFTRLIDSLYPEGERPSALERERTGHEAFARSRASVYIGRQEYVDRLDAHVASDAPPLVVLGESGGGKSALLANWTLGYRRRHPEDFVLLHFNGASAEGANATTLLRRILLELKQRFELPDEVPVQPEKLREDFPNWLEKVAGRGRIVLVVDALNHLEDLDSAPDLSWLPRVFPKNCRVIVSTLPGRSLTAIEQRGWTNTTSPLEVRPLDEAERRRLIREFLGKARDLGSARTERLVHAGQTANPLYLRVLLNELRVFGFHDKLDDEVERYLDAKDSYELYRKVIARWDKAYADGTGLVRDTLSLLWAARHGLSEAEILGALGQPGQPMPRATWSPLFLAMSDALVSRNGLLTFAHDFFRLAARNEYLPNEQKRQAAHRKVANYIQEQSTWSDRKLDELPWQLAAIHDWEALHETLTQGECFVGLWRRNQHELLAYWLQLKPQFDPGVSYTMAFASWSRNRPLHPGLGVVANDLGLFLEEAGCYAAAEPLMRRSLAIAEASDGVEHPNVAVCLNSLAGLLLKTNRFEAAEPLIRRAIAIDENFYGAEHPRVAFGLDKLARLLQVTNRLADAEPLMRRAIAIVEQSYGANYSEVAAHRNNLAQLLLATNRVGEAEPLMRRALASAEDSYGFNHPKVLGLLNNLTMLLQDTNRLAEAEPLARRAVAIAEESYGVQHPNVALALSILAQLLKATSRFAEAEPLMRRALAIIEGAVGSDHPDVASCLNNLAMLLKATRRLAEAEPLVLRALAIDEGSYGPDHPNVAVHLNNLAMLLQATRRLAEAEPLMRRALAIYEKSHGSEHPRVATCVSNLAHLLKVTSRFVEAEPLMRRALAIEEKSYGADHPNVAACLNNLAQLLRATNRIEEAMSLTRRSVAIHDKFKAGAGHEHPNARATWANLGSLYFSKVRFGCISILVGVVVLVVLAWLWARWTYQLRT